MNNLLDKYFANKRKELCDYTNYIMTLFEYNAINEDNKKQVIKKVFEIYFDNFYMAKIVDTNEVNNFFSISNDVVDFRCLLQSLLIYYKDTKIDMESINYYAAIMYTAIIVDRSREQLLTMPYKSLFLFNVIKVINPNFKFDNNNKKDKIISKLIQDIKTNIKNNKRLKTNIENVMDSNSYNEYTELVSRFNLYKTDYCFNVNGLDKYKRREVNKIFNKEDYDSQFVSLSFDLITLTLLKALLKNKDLYLAIDLKRKFYSKKKNVNALLKMIDNKYLKEHVKIYILESEYGNEDMIKLLENHGLKVFVDSNKYEFVTSIDMTNKILLANQTFLTNFREELDKKGIKYQMKDSEYKVTDSTIFSPRVEEKKEERNDE